MASLIRMSPLLPTAAERHRESVMTLSREALLKERQAVLQPVVDNLQRLVVTTQRGDVPLPSEAALQIIWSLNAVRDALCDQNQATLDKTNAQIRKRLGDENVKDKVLPWLDQHHGGPGGVAEDFKAQFEYLPDQNKIPFEQSRRKRLAALSAFERRVMVEVDDTKGKPL